MMGKTTVHGCSVAPVPRPPWNRARNGEWVRADHRRTHPQSVRLDRVETQNACSILTFTGNLARDREVLVFYRSGQRAYCATRILLQNGFKARGVSGGMLSGTD
jgi:rhodanese-related sulfurtransferase